MTRILLLALLALGVALPAWGETYKNTYPMACSDLWPAVKDTLGNADNYQVLKMDDAQMAATYKVKHSVHVNVSGALLQRNNKVKLVTMDNGCEMQVVSNYSGWEHNDQGDFKTRVEASLERLKAAKPAEPAKPTEGDKNAKPAKASD